MLSNIAQKMLLKIGPETAHDLMILGLKKTCNTPLANLYRQDLSSKPLSVMGLEFPNRVGLAAGLDKNGEAIDAFYDMGFGHVEIGTVTPRAQSGNPKPRIFRIPEKKAIINRMGFNNQGIERVLCNLSRKKTAGIVGINIGKNRNTPLEKSTEDYLFCLDQVYPFASYVTVNISSPNTPELRSLQFGSFLSELLSRLKERQDELANRYDRYVPLVIKIAPDLNISEIKSISEAVLEINLDGIIATNTTVDHSPVVDFKHSKEEGGLSGAPLFESSIKVISALYKLLGNKIPIIGVGGIMTAEDAEKIFSSGAKLIQIYSGFIYHGPNLIKRINSLDD